MGEAEAFILALIFALGFTARAAAGGRGRSRPFGRIGRWRRWRAFALGGLTWTEAAFWDCSWRGFLDAWAGYRRFVLGLDPDDRP